jgi:hypothetical protein
MSHNVTMLNINGISLLDNRIILFMDFLYANDIDILLIQEVMAYCLDNIPGYVHCSGWYYTYSYRTTPDWMTHGRMDWTYFAGEYVSPAEHLNSWLHNTASMMHGCTCPSVEYSHNIPKIVLDLPAKMQPADHMSIEVVYSLAPNKTSGGRYHNVTTSAE